LHNQIDWNDVRIVFAVAKHGSLNRASAALGIDQATVSRRLAALEERAGIPLFFRSSMGTRPTEFGAMVAKKASQVHDVISEIHELFDARTAGQAVTIRAPEGIATYILAPILSDTPTYFPKEIGNVKKYARLFPVRFVDDGCFCDIELIHVPRGWDIPRDGNLRVRRVGRMRFVPVAGKRYIGLCPPPATERDLRFHRLIQHTAYDAIPSFAPWNEVVRSGSALTMAAGTSSALHSSIITSGGVTMLPDFSPVLDSSVVELSGIIPDAFVDLYLVSPPECVRVNAVRHVFDALVDIFSNIPWFNNQTA